MGDIPEVRIDECFFVIMGEDEMTPLILGGLLQPVCNRAEPINCDLRILAQVVHRRTDSERDAPCVCPVRRRGRGERGELDPKHLSDIAGERRQVGWQKLVASVETTVLHND
jgi:hypothetical protein